MDVSETENIGSTKKHDSLSTQERDQDVTHVVSKVRFPSCRLVLVFMGFLGFVNIYILRVNLSVALVAMVNHTQLPYTNLSRNYSGDIADDVCQSDESTVEIEDVKSGEFNWDSHTQGAVLAAFFFGYVFTQV